MDVDLLQRKLLAAGRRLAASDHVPYAFHQRIMAHLRSAPKLDHWAQWATGLWRAAASCVAIMLLLAAWAWFRPAKPHADLAQELENTMLATADQEPPPADSLP